ncbi:hypothetical protein R50072_07140 [Simiduia litorea]
MLTFSVQLLASAVPPCSMLSTGSIVAMASMPGDVKSMDAMPIHDALTGHEISHQGMDHQGMNHNGMEHSTLAQNDHGSSSASMACCLSEQNCDMDSCMMAPVMPSLLYTAVDIALHLKPVITAQAAMTLFIETLFHPPRFA